MKNEILSNEIAEQEFTLPCNMSEKEIGYLSLASVFQDSLEFAEKKQVALEQTEDKVYAAYYEGQVSAYKEVIFLLLGSI